MPPLRRYLSPSPGALFASFLVVMALDLLAVGFPFWAKVGTLTQSALCVSWLATVLQLDQQDRSCDAATFRVRSRQRWWHFGNLAVLALLLFEKWSLVLAYTAIQPDDAPTYRLMSGAVTLVATAGLLGRGHRLARFFALLSEHPARFMALTFLLCSMFGGVLLALPMAVRPGEHVSFLDGWFMATSAVCVTGLAVHSVATTHTFVGQTVLLALVQIGGLGIMVLSASFVVLAGRKMQGKSRSALIEALDADSMDTLRSAIRRIVGFTFAIEACGACLLWLAFTQHPAVALPHTIEHPLAGAGPSVWWSAIFHAVSAFCNAGFSLSRDNLMGFSTSWPVCTVIMVLIVLGGIGFPVMSELLDRVPQWLRRRHRAPRLSLHARTVIVVSAALIVVSALSLLALEWSGSMRSQAVHERLLSALFQSVTLRTAGFNTVDIGAFDPPTLFVCCLVMFIGASPGSTGGGIKTTSFAVFFAVFRAELRGGTPRFLDRRLSASTVSRAVSAAFVSVVVLTVVVLALFITEPKQPPMAMVFEAVSAFATVGLSTGITMQLSPWGKLLIITTMLIGRVGPLTFALAATGRARRAYVDLPEERLMIG